MTTAMPDPRPDLVHELVNAVVDLELGRQREADEYRAILGRVLTPEPGDAKRLLELAAVLGKPVEHVQRDARRAAELAQIDREIAERQDALARIDQRVAAAKARAAAVDAAAQAPDATLRAAQLGAVLAAELVGTADRAARLREAYLRARGWRLGSLGWRPPGSVENYTGMPISLAMKRAAADDLATVGDQLLAGMQSIADAVLGRN